MDEARFDQLLAKKDAEGLTNDEANELGRLYAERAGRQYSNAGEQAHPDSSEVREQSEPGSADWLKTDPRQHQQQDPEKSTEEEAKEFAG